VPDCGPSKSTWRYSCQPRIPSSFFNHALIFSKFLHAKNQIYLWNMQKIIALIFWLWKPRSLTHTVVLSQNSFRTLGKNVNHSDLIKLINNNINGIELVVQVSISPTFYVQLLYMQIPKVQKDSKVVSIFCSFGICVCKSCSENVDEIGNC